MTEIEKKALVLFKEASLYQLKEREVELFTSLSDNEREILEMAMELHRCYNYEKDN